MSYERQRATALRMIKKAGAQGTLVNKRLISYADKPWLNTEETVTTPVYYVAFADDGVTFVDHNIQGDVRVLTVVSNATINIQVGDVIIAGTQNYSVELAKPLDPDMEGAILWAALVK